MAKSEGRGWRKWAPNKYTVAKVFLALVVIKFIQTAVGKYVPPTVQPYLPYVG
jgi:hypothetical protein